MANDMSRSATAAAKPMVLGVLASVLLGLLWTGLAAVPVWVLWSACGLGQRYFSSLPTVWLHPPIVDVIELFWLVASVRTAASPIRVSATLGKR